MQVSIFVFALKINLNFLSIYYVVNTMIYLCLCILRISVKKSYDIDI